MPNLLRSSMNGLSREPQPPGLKGISKERYVAAQARCRAIAGNNDPVCNELNADDVLLSEAAAAKRALANSGGK